MVRIELHGNKLAVEGLAYCRLVEYLFIKAEARLTPRCPKMNQQQSIGLASHPAAFLEIVNPPHPRVLGLVSRHLCATDAAIGNGQQVAQGSQPAS
jgi:hypothetical protein